MFNSLKSKLIVPITVLLVLMIVAFVLYVRGATRNLTDELTNQRIDLAVAAANARLSDFEDQAMLIAKSAAGDYAIINGVLNWNEGIDRPETRQALISRLAFLADDLGADGFVMRGADGYIIIRSHDLGHYGDRAQTPAADAALAGNISFAYTATGAMPMAISITIPIRYDNAVVGTLAANIFLHTTGFVDAFGEVFDATVTVYNRIGDNPLTSVMNTVTAAGGGRAVGVELDPDIAEIVLAGDEHYDTVTIDGSHYIVYYRPLIGAGGNTTGTLFFGFSNDVAVTAANRLQRNMLIIGIVVLAIAASFMYFLINSSLKPIDRLKGDVKAVAAGNVNVNLRLSDMPNDEIGELSRDIHNLMSVIINMVDDLQALDKAYNVEGDTDYRVDTGKYENSFKEVMKCVNNIPESTSSDVRVLLDALRQINAGEFNLEIKELPGKKQKLPETIRATVAHLNSVTTEIGSMVETATQKGDMEFEIDESKYHGGWRGIMSGLNEVARSVNKPIIELRDSMERLSNGDFSVTVKGDYKGTFLQMKEAVNSTVNILSGYISEINNVLAHVSDGDLTQTIDREYVGSFSTIKHSLNNISAKLSQTVKEIHVAADHVLAGAKQINASALDLAEGTFTQADSVQALNTSVETINGQTRANVSNAAEANELSHTSTANAQKGNEAMKQTLSAMSQIKNSSNDISKIIRTIQDIAFQTNLLALNAAVEAARAGEHGKGFAVVAEEVRSLAARSQAAAGETTELINNSINTVEAGAAIAQATAETLDTIVENANRVSSIVSAITDASKEQADAISQVSSGLNQISDVVNNNSAVSEETATSSSELASQAELLRKLVSAFKL